MATATAPSTDDPHVSRVLDYSFSRRVLRESVPQLLAGAVGMTLASMCMVAMPLLGSEFIKMLIQGDSFQSASKFLGLLVVSYVLEPLFSRLYILSVWTVGERIIAGIKEEVFRSLLVQKIEFYDQNQVGEVMTMLGVETTHLRNLLHNNLSRERGFRAVVEAAMVLAVLLSQSVTLALFLGGTVISVSTVVALYSASTWPVYAADSAAGALSGGIGVETLANIRTVRSFAGERQAMGVFRWALQQMQDTGNTIGVTKANTEGMNRLAIYVALLALYGGGGWLVACGSMPVVILLSSIGFAFSLVFCTQGVVNSIMDLNVAKAAMHRINELLTALPLDATVAAALPVDPADPAAAAAAAAAAPAAAASTGEETARARAARGADVRLSDVTFAYPVRPHAPVLGGTAPLELTLEGGKVTALVGGSGSGKSTIAALISRFYTPDLGCVSLDGHDIRQFSHGEWADAVGLVSQEPVLFSGTIADNIAYGDPYAADRQTRIEQAAIAANAHSFVCELPNGYQSEIGERGVLLSGGQKQRLAIARAVYKDSPVLILDEATSALDSVSEALVQQALDRLMQRRTTLVIAHRLSTVQRADRIVVLDAGNVVETGTHDELLKAGGAYSRLVDAQRLVAQSTVSPGENTVDLV